MQYQKVKSVAKQMVSRGPKLQSTILSTLQTCADLVGSTLGPGGMSVVIEHQETGMAPMVTKDGVTVFRSLGFPSASQQVLMETARDAAIRTASEAGDGTTTATILAESFVRRTMEFCNNNPHMSPQRVVRNIQKLFDTKIVPAIDLFKIQPSLADEEGRQTLRSVARISANGDDDLAGAVMECFDIIGDEGNVTISEQTGPSKYIVQKIDGYPVPIGFEDSCGPFFQKFVNDPSTQTVVLDRPSFILNYGRITDFNQLYPILSLIAMEVSGDNPGKLTHNVVIVATGFSETVLANLAAGFVQEGTLNVYPLMVPMFPTKSGPTEFLADVAALTGATIYDTIEKPLQNFELDGLGFGPRLFEANRFRSNIIGNRDEVLVFDRVDQIQKQLTEAAVSELEKAQLRERLAKMTSGIAKLIVQGSSNGEIKERRDRAEDAICAVRGAIKHGALPGGGSTLFKLSEIALNSGEISSEIFSLALLEPIRKLYSNAGYSKQEADEMVGKLLDGRAYDVLEQKWVDPVATGLLDSLPAVREAIRNSISIASLLGTCGGVVNFNRDEELERTEARDTADFLRNANFNPANERP